MKTVTSQKQRGKKRETWVCVGGVCVCVCGGGGGGIEARGVEDIKVRWEKLKRRKACSLLKESI